MNTGPRETGRFFRYVFQLEDILVNLIVLSVAFLLCFEIIARNFFQTGIKNSTVYIQHLVLVATFLAGAITSRQKKHLTLAARLPLKEPAATVITTIVHIISAALTFAFAASAFSFSLNAFSPSEKVGFIPRRLIGLVMVLGFIIMATRFITSIEPKRKRGLWLLVALALALLISTGLIPGVIRGLSGQEPGMVQNLVAPVQDLLASLATPLIIILIILAFFGMPVFVVLGGAGLLLMARSELPLEIVANQAYTVLTDYSIPAIPLFAAAGFFLSESRAGTRLVDFFRDAVGWLPGGLTVVTVLVCAFFTTFTGGSGITIIALGGLLLQILMQAGYNKKFSVGLLTSSGSVGLLFPPSLPIIIYGVTAGVSIKDMFRGGILPGAVLVAVTIIAAFIFSAGQKVERQPFHWKKLPGSFRKGLGEILLPLVIIGLYFGGITNLQESAAVALVYAFLLETLVHRDLKLKDIPRVMTSCVTVFGGVLVILAVVNGLSYYIIDTQLPQRLSEWLGTAISSRYLFLLLLNLALLVVGCFLDIYSAILVVVPLIVPLAGVFNIHPVHLGVIFLANLELGYLTPPVGLNLFLASYRFNEPMGRVYRDVLGFMMLRLAAVLLITYLPFLATALL
ncbi:MAG: TRAP transporter large permease subunit [Candidatus Saccharicenans sp.]|nr:TRAP transporter large permease subunit [Candidatus Saccharicenans sp.]MDH7575672.1 TRAP transporter large permease subunit [Candidatus Saccharicenans sp.]